MESNERRLSDKEIRKATIKAFKAVIRSISQEPSDVIVVSNAKTDTACPTDEITEWLFHRRDNDGSTDD